MNRKDNITVAALRLFWLRGYNYVSLTDVAKELGITKGGIYHYFSSKEELLREAVCFLFDRLEQKYGELFTCTTPLQEIIHGIIVEQKLEQYAHELLGISPEMGEERHVPFALEIMKHFPDIQKRLDSSHTSCRRIVEKRLEEAVKNREVRSQLNGAALGTIIFSFLGGYHHPASRLSSRDERIEVADTLMKMLVS